MREKRCKAGSWEQGAGSPDFPTGHPPGGKVPSGWLPAPCLCRAPRSLLRAPRFSLLWAPVLLSACGMTVAAAADDPPVTPPLDRAAGNFVAELRAALDGKQYADAARMLVRSDPPTQGRESWELGAGSGEPGLSYSPLPAPGSQPMPGSLLPAPCSPPERLFVSYPTALRLLFLEHPELREAAIRQVGPADELKIEQALAQGDPAAVAALSLQYRGTPSAALACQWLGDRALAAADLAQALDWYDEGLWSASPLQQPDLAARKRLVAAMFGAAEGQPPTQAVAFGAAKVPPEQFEGWIRGQLAPGAGRPACCPPRRRPSLDQRRKARPFSSHVLRVFPRRRRSVWRRRLAVAAPVGADRSGLDVRHRSSADHRLRSGGRKNALGRPLEQRPRGGTRYSRVRCSGTRRAAAPGLRSTPLPSRPRGPTGSACSASMPSRVKGSGWPIVAGRRPPIRSGSTGGSSCSPWGRPGGPRPGGAGDPSMLCLVELNPDTGEVLATRPILEIAEPEKVSSECQASLAGNRFVVVLAGNVICIDLQGKMVWFRAKAGSSEQGAGSPDLPAGYPPGGSPLPAPRSEEPSARIFVEQPGSRAIDCLNLATGQCLWRRDRRSAIDRRSAGGPALGADRARIDRPAQGDGRGPLAAGSSRYARGHCPHQFGPAALRGRRRSATSRRS